MSKIDSDRLKVEYLSPHDLRSSVGNAKIHPKRQIDKIVKSIKRFGFVNPVLISDDMEVVAGHGRVEAAKLLRLEHVPVVRLSGLTAAERLAYTLADNRLGEFGRYDRKKVAIQLKQLQHLRFDEIDVTGFALGELDIRLDQPAELNGHHVGPDDELPTPRKWVVSHRGDLWKLGRHSLLCGDPTSAADVRRLMRGQLAEVVFLDPPRCVAAGSFSGLGGHFDPEVAMAQGARSEPDLNKILSSALRLAKAASKAGAVTFAFSSALQLYHLLAAARDEQLPLETLIVWAKRDAEIGGLYRSQHQLIAVLKNPDTGNLKCSKPTQHGRHRSNLWEYAGGSSPDASRADELVMRPSRPLSLIGDAIRDVSGKGAIVLDMFAGTGSTLIAAEKTGRRAYLLEVEPAYCDLILRRFHHSTGQAAELDGEGLTFGDVEKSRFADRTSPSIHND